MRRLFVAALTVSALAACVGPEDRPSHVKDLRVLAARNDPPEIMAPSCPDLVNPQDADLSQFLSFLQPIEYRALIADPSGGGREIAWDLWVCAQQGDRDCENAPDRVRIAAGTTTAGELTFTIPMLAATMLPGPDGIRDDPETSEVESDDDVPLLQRIIDLEGFRILGGIRVPVTLHLKAGDEEIWAMKLMVFNCPWVEGMVQNVNPELPGLTLGGAEWPDTEVPLLKGEGPFEIEPLDFSDLQEAYVVSSYERQPVNLKEAWEVAWYADYGRFSQNITGGADYGGGTVRHRIEWVPPADGREERDVRFWVVARDGRGGITWITRTAHYTP